MYAVFKELLKRKGVTVADVSRATGINQSTLSNWKVRNNLLSGKNAQKVADYFGVTVDYLMTGEAPNPQKFTVVPEFNEFEKALVRAYREADEPVQIVIDRLLNIEDLKTALFSKRSKEA